MSVSLQETRAARSTPGGHKLMVGICRNAAQPNTVLMHSSCLYRKSVGQVGPPSAHASRVSAMRFCTDDRRRCHRITGSNTLSNVVRTYLSHRYAPTRVSHAFVRTSTHCRRLCSLSSSNRRQTRACGPLRKPQRSSRSLTRSWRWRRERARPFPSPGGPGRSPQPAERTRARFCHAFPVKTRVGGGGAGRDTVVWNAYAQGRARSRLSMRLLPPVAAPVFVHSRLPAALVPEPAITDTRIRMESSNHSPIPALTDSH